MKNIILSLILSVFSHFAFSETKVPEDHIEEQTVSEAELRKARADYYNIFSKNNLTKSQYEEQKEKFRKALADYISDHENYLATKTTHIIFSEIMSEELGVNEEKFSKTNEEKLSKTVEDSLPNATNVPKTKDLIFPESPYEKQTVSEEKFRKALADYISDHENYLATKTTHIIFSEIMSEELGVNEEKFSKTNEEKLSKTVEDSLPNATNVPKTKDLIFPESPYEKQTVSEEKFGKALADNFSNVLEVYDISFSEELYLGEVAICILSLGACTLIPEWDIFSISFSITTTDESVYENIKCSIQYNSKNLHEAKDKYNLKNGISTLLIRDCRNELYSFSDDKMIFIPVHQILDYSAGVTKDISVLSL